MNKLEELINQIHDRNLSFEIEMSLVYVEEINKFIKATNLENQINVKRDSMNFKISARRLIRKYLGLILELEGKVLKDKIVNLKDSEVIEFILSQSKRNAYNKEPDNIWQLKNTFKEFDGADISFYKFYKIIEYIYKSKDLYNIDLIENIKLESYNL